MPLIVSAEVDLSRFTLIGYSICPRRLFSFAWVYSKVIVTIDLVDGGI